MSELTQRERLIDEAVKIAIERDYGYSGSSGIGWARRTVDGSPSFADGLVFSVAKTIQPTIRKLWPLRRDSRGRFISRRMG